MKARIQLVEPNKMLATVTITMSVSEWRELNEQLTAKWPSWAFSKLLGDVIAKATASFDADTETQA